MRSTPELDAKAGLTKLTTYPYQIATWVDDDGYPVSVAIEATIEPDAGTAVLRGAGRADPADRRPPGLAHRLAYPAAAGLRLRRAAPRDGVGRRPTGDRRDDRLRRHDRMGLGRGRGPVLRVLGALGAAVTQVLRCVVRGARDAGQAPSLVRLADPARDAPAVPERDDRAGHARDPHRRVARVVRSRGRAADDHRCVVRPARAERRQRRVRHAVRAPTTRTSRRPSSRAARGSSSTASSACARWRRSRPCSTSSPGSSG